MWLHSVLRRIVRNDAIHIDPPEIYNWRVLALAASVSLETLIPSCCVLTRAVS